jgi:hypothetical protein
MNPVTTNARNLQTTPPDCDLLAVAVDVVLMMMFLRVVATITPILQRTTLFLVLQYWTCCLHPIDRGQILSVAQMHYSPLAVLCYVASIKRPRATFIVGALETAE